MEDGRSETGCGRVWTERDWVRIGCGLSWKEDEGERDWVGWKTEGSETGCGRVWMGVRMEDGGDGR